MFEKKSPQNEFHLTLNMRQLSLAMAGLLASSFFIFTGGYFLGKKRAVQEFSYQADQDSLADQIYSSMCVLYDAKDDEETNDNQDEAEGNDLTENTETSETVASVEQKNEIQQKNYKMTLAGFSAGNIEEAKKMVARLTKSGYSAQVIEIPSKTAKGKTVVWYQVIAKISITNEDLKNIQHNVARVAQVKEKSIRIDECV